MKYVLALLGSVVISTCVWAAPEAMVMYTTISNPVASFWEVEADADKTTTMENGSTLNLGVVSNNKGSRGGKILLSGDSSRFFIESLKMEKDTKFVVGQAVQWKVGTLNIGDTAEVSLEGDLIVNTLNINSSNPTIVRVEGKLVLNQDEISVPDATFSSISVGSGTKWFKFEGKGTAGDAQVQNGSSATQPIYVTKKG